MIDRDFVGAVLAPYTVAVERDRLRRYAAAVGLPGAVFTDEAAARAAGHPDLPVPPALLAGFERQEPGDFLADLGVRLSDVRHVEQGFVHHRAVYAGDLLTFAPVITDIRTRRGLDFVVRDTAVSRDGALVAELHQVILVQPGGK
ncbi:MaoC family dehydratase N-terminal domain-containing protein [Streptomyces sp. NBC_00038]|uniref:FAS1-like dehydratase domain-containing protein n=1 Tax=Streptomyces sp. NBC_00038 TaxID=2903615 RepID=UPI00225A1F8F|nr:MaoC family dehydratase N-terminal domain-containing protein [Streptomyces sp. NBC_00038]MCX5555754.1 MaoC family dehydratase N-terminal domain-containing protein [Streptomyces sp. NBC_00038]